MSTVFFKIWKKCQPECYAQRKYPTRIKGKSKHSQTKKTKTKKPQTQNPTTTKKPTPREFVASRPTLNEWLNMISEQKGNDKKKKSWNTRKQKYGQIQQVFPLLQFWKLYVKVKEKIITLKWLEMFIEEIFKTIINSSR